jgi:hypothetical protein
MFNGFKARIRKLAELTHTDFCKMLEWGTPIVCENPQALICSASTGGETVAFAVAEPCVVFGSLALKPGANADDVSKAGAAIDAAIAQQTTFGRVLVELPEDVPAPPGMKTLRFVERHLSKLKQHHESLPELQRPQTSWIN